MSGTDGPVHDEVQPLGVAQWDQRLGHVVADMRGQPLNIHGLMAHNPALLDAWWSLRQHVVHSGKLGNRHRELVVLRGAAHHACWYEWASHVERGLAAGLTRDEIDAVTFSSPQPAWDEHDRLVLRAVDDLVELNRISAATLEAMQGRFETAAILDIVAIHGVYAMLATMIETWGLELDAFVALPAGQTAQGWAPAPPALPK